MTDSEGKIELFTKSNFGLAFGFQVNPNSCGNHIHYEQYISFVALSDNVAGKGTTYVFSENIDGKDTLLGYITLRATSYIKITEDKLFGNPAMEIFELAVSKDAERRGIGTILVKFALTKAMELNETALGIRYITLCADSMAVPFYEKFGFKRMDEFGEVPRENWNQECIPMVLKLPERPL